MGIQTQSITRFLLTKDSLPDDLKMFIKNADTRPLESELIIGIDMGHRKSRQTDIWKN